MYGLDTDLIRKKKSQKRKQCASGSNPFIINRRQLEAKTAISFLAQNIIIYFRNAKSSRILQIRVVENV